MVDLIPGHEPWADLPEDPAARLRDLRGRPQGMAQDAAVRLHRHHGDAAGDDPRSAQGAPRAALDAPVV